MTRLAGKTALIVGCGAGIGAAIAERFAEEGARAIVTGTSGSENAVAAAHPDALTPQRCDIGDEQQVLDLLRDCRARFGRLDIVVNNAASRVAPSPLHQMPTEDWDALMSVNLRGAFLVMKAAIALMLETGGGAILNIGSTSSFRATAGSAAYAASKGGLVMLTRGAALDYVKHGIRINALCPGTVDTPRLDRLAPEVVQQLAERIPMGRLCTPAEVASFALFLCSDEAGYVTGQAYVLDGGRFAG